MLLFMVSSGGCVRSPEAQFQKWNKKGDAHYAQREYEKALTAWSHARAIKSDDPKLYRKIGKAYVRLAYFDKAIESLHKATLLAPNNSKIRLELAKLQIATQKIEEAEASWERIRSNENDPQIQVFYGDLMVVKNRLPEAITAYRNAASLKPNFDLALVKLASCYLAQDQPDLANSILVDVLSRSPRSAKVLLEIASYYKMKQNLGTAEGYLQRAIDRDPEDLSLRSMLAEFYFEIGEFKKARRTLRTILTEAPDNRPLKKLLIEVLLSTKNMHEAETVLAELTAELENDIELYLLLGKYHLMNHNPTVAGTYFNRAIEQVPNFPLSHYLLGIAYLSGGHISLAQNSLIHALSLDRYFTEAELTLADVYYKKEEIDLATEHVQRIIDREPENFRARLIMGNILLAGNKPDEAITHFHAARLLHPNSPSSLYYLAFASQQIDQMESALELYLSLLQKKPKLVDAAMHYALILAEQGETATVVRYLKNAMKEFPKNAFLYHILGEVHLVAGSDKEAEPNFLHAITINSRLPRSYMRLAEIYTRQSNSKRLVATLKACTEKLPNFSDAYIHLGEFYRKIGNYDQAIACLERGSEINPDSPKLANCLAWLYLENKKKLDKAFKLAQFAYQRLPEDPAVADTLGWIYYQKTFFTQAAWLLKDAASRAPDNPIIHFHLGMTFYKMHDKKSAAESLSRALSLGLDSIYVQEATRLYNELQEELP